MAERREGSPRDAAIGHLRDANDIRKEFADQDGISLAAAQAGMAVAQVDALKAIASALIYIGDQMSAVRGQPVGQWPWRSS